MLVSAVSGRCSCAFRPVCQPGHVRRPTHAVEEVLTVLEGRAEIWVGDDRAEVGAGHSVIVPAGIKHGFRNVSETDPLHVRATLAAPIFEASYEDRNELAIRYVPSG